MAQPQDLEAGYPSIAGRGSVESYQSFQFPENESTRPKEEATKEESKKRTHVFINLRVFDVPEVNCKEQFFAARFFLEAMWEAKEEKGKITNWNWNPRIAFGNSLEPYQKEHERRELDFYLKPGQVFVAYRVIGMCKFSCQLEYQGFPFDVQELLINVRSHHPANDVEFEINQRKHNCYLDSGNFTACNDFWFERKMTTNTCAATNNEGSRMRAGFPSCDFCMMAWREPNYLVMKVMLPTVLISLIGLYSFAYEETDEPNEDLEKRFSVNSTLLLTLFAIKFASADDFPRVNYLTLADKFLLISILIQWFMIFIPFLLSLFGDPVDQPFSSILMKRWTSGVLLGLVIGILLAYFFALWFVKMHVVKPRKKQYGGKNSQDESDPSKPESSESSESAELSCYERCIVWLDKKLSGIPYLAIPGRDAVIERRQDFGKEIGLLRNLLRDQKGQPPDPELCVTYSGLQKCLMNSKLLQHMIEAKPELGQKKIIKKLLRRCHLKEPEQLERLELEKPGSDLKKLHQWINEKKEVDIDESHQIGRKDDDIARKDVVVFIRELEQLQAEAVPDGKKKTKEEEDEETDAREQAKNRIENRKTYNFYHDPNYEFPGLAPGEAS